MNKVEGNPMYQRIHGSGNYEKEKANGMENSSMLRTKRLMRINF